MTDQPIEPKQPNKRGRKTKLTPELQAKLVQVLEAGNYIDAACGYVGIHVDTFYDWLNKNSEFSDAVGKARANAEVSSVARIRQSAIGGKPISIKKITQYAKDGTIKSVIEETRLDPPKSDDDKWWLERSFPDRWGRTRQDINVTIDPYSDAIKKLRDERKIDG